MKKPVGRPSKYTKVLADEIYNKLAEGKSLRTICLSESMPDKATIFRWLKTNKQFRDQYAHAKEASAVAMAEEILDIADDGTNDWMTIGRGDSEREVENREVVNRSKLRVDARKWLLSKLVPKKYGDKLDMTTDGKPLPAPIYGGKSTNKV